MKKEEKSGEERGKVNNKVEDVDTIVEANGLFDCVLWLPLFLFFRFFVAVVLVLVLWFSIWKKATRCKTTRKLWKQTKKKCCAAKAQKRMRHVFFFIFFIGLCLWYHFGAQKLSVGTARRARSGHIQRNHLTSSFSFFFFDCSPTSAEKNIYSLGMPQMSHQLNQR